jgi:hypothetical protein
MCGRRPPTHPPPRLWAPLPTSASARGGSGRRLMRGNAGRASPRAQPQVPWPAVCWAGRGRQLGAAVAVAAVPQHPPAIAYGYPLGSCLPPLPCLLPRCSQQAPADIGGQAQGQHRRQAGGWWQRRWRPQARHAGCAAVGLQLCRPGAGGLAGCLLGFPPAAAARQVAHWMHSGSARQC